MLEIRYVIFRKRIINTFFVPFITLLFSLKDIRSTFTKRVFYIFCIWIGTVFIYNISPYTLNEDNVRSSDSSKTALQFIYMNLYKQDLITSISNRNIHDKYDFFQFLSLFFLSRLSGNPRIWFIYVAFIYGFFHVNNTWYILQRCKRPIDFICGFFIALLIFCIPITEGLNATRMNLAIQIFIYGTLPYIVENDKSKIWISFLCIFVHFSMLLPLLIFVLFLIVPSKKITPYLILFIISFFINEIDLYYVDKILNYFPLGIGERFGIYTAESSIQLHHNWVTKSSLFYLLSRKINPIICFVTIVALRLFDNETLENTHWRKLLTFSLVFYSYANIVSSLPSGYRYLRIANILLYSWIILTVNNYCTKQLKAVSIVLCPIMLYGIVWSLRLTFDYLGLQIIWGNFITTIFFEDNTPISKILGLTY